MIPEKARERRSPAGLYPPETVMDDLREAISRSLAPNVREIDARGEYPEAFMREVGALGGYAQGTPAALGGTGRSIGETIRVMKEVSRTCLSTGFCVWCQTVCAWYIQNGGSGYLKEHVLPGILSGQTLAGTGLSNPMKHFSGIERIKIRAEPRPGGYVLSGAVPWVSNAGDGHYFAVVAGLPDGEYVMAVVRGGDAGLDLGSGGQFIALEGSNTYSVRLREAFVPEEAVLASPATEYIKSIRPGFMLTQTGIGLGLVEGCLDLMGKANARADIRKSGVNDFLDDGVESLGEDLEGARERTYALAAEIGCGETPPRPDLLPEVIEARIAASELSLRASRAAMLHMGASGYRLHGATERKLRESYFVAVVTPALKHLKKVLHDLRQNS